MISEERFARERVFEESIIELVRREVLARITEAVADDLIVPDNDVANRLAVGESLLRRLHPKAAAELVLYLVQHLIDEGHLNWCDEDRSLWEGWGRIEVVFPKDPDEEDDGQDD